MIENDEPLDGIIDSAAFSNNGMGSRADEMNKKFDLRWRPAEKGWNSRLAGISAIHQRLAQREDGSVGLRIFKNCRQLIHELPGLTHSVQNPEDIDDPNDHSFDCLRYALTKKVRVFHRMVVKGL